MIKYAIGFAALAAATAAAAAVPVNFGSAPGNLGNSHPYTASGLTVTATGYASNGVQTALFGKSAGGDEIGLGLNGYTDNEITGPGTDFIQLDVSSILASVSSATFFMGSSTANEWWAVFGTNTLGTRPGGSPLISGFDEASHALPNWGSYKYYDFVALGTKNQYNQFTAGNVLLGGLSLTQAVPEPSTWAFMLLGFGGIGLATRRRRRTLLARIA